MRNTLLPSVHRIESEVTALYDVASRLRAEVATLRQQLTDPSVAPGAQPGTDAAIERQAQAALQSPTVTPQPAVPQPAVPQSGPGGPPPAVLQPPTVAAAPAPRADATVGAKRGFFAGRPGTSTSLRGPGQPVEQMAAQQGIATAYAPPPMPPRAPSTPWWERDGAITKVVAVAGAAMTLVGVGFFLVLAAQAGLLAPPVRIAMALAAAVVLSTIAAVVHGRHASGASGWRQAGVWFTRGVAETTLRAQAGAVALAAVGFATAATALVAATVTYAYVAPMVGVGLVAGLTCGGLLLARRWHSELFAVIAVTAFMLLTPYVGKGVSVTTVAFMVVMTAGSMVAHLGRSWVYLQVARAVLPVVVVWIAVSDRFAGEQTPQAAAAWMLALMGLGQAMLAWQERAIAPTPGDPLLRPAQAREAGGDWGSRLFRAVVATPPSVALHRRRDIRATSLGVIWYAIPVVVMALTWERAGALWFSAALAVIFGAAATRRELLAPSARAACAVLTIPGLLGVVYGLFVLEQGGIDWRVAASVLMAAGLFVAARHFRSAISACLGAAYLFVPACMAGLTFFDMWTLEDAERAGTVDTIVVLSALAVAWAACAWMLGAVRESFPDFPFRRWMAMIFAVLSASFATVLLGTHLTMHRWDSDPSGYYAAHAVVTVAWASLGWWVLRGRIGGSNPHWRRRLGLVVVAAVVAKLLLHDVASLDGILRVAAFLGAGLFLLVMAVTQGRSLISDDSSTPPANG